MYVLIVVVYYYFCFFIYVFVVCIVEGVVCVGYFVEIVDLVVEGFELCFGLVDYVVYCGQVLFFVDVFVEQVCIDCVDILVLVYLIYWWLMLVLFKGWIDCVFFNGWVFDYSIGGDLWKKLQCLCVVLVGVGGVDVGIFEWYGYVGVMCIQIDYGIFDYCGVWVVCFELLLELEIVDLIWYLDQVLYIGSQFFVVCGVQGVVQVQLLEV